MTKTIGALLLSITLTSILGGCVIHEERRCAYGWEPGHRDRYGRWIEGHCR
jgi:hypothetical protein